MAFCPKCRYEYETHVNVCPDCQERLVSSLEAEVDLDSPSPLEDEEWVKLARLTSREYAFMVQQVLDRRGIPCVIQSEAGHHGQFGSGVSSYLAGSGGYLIFALPDFVVAADVAGVAVLGDVWKAARLIDIDKAEPPADDGDPA